MKKMLGAICWTLLCGGLLAQVSPQIGIRTFQAPEYPTVARQARIQGEVHLQLMVNTDGKITSVAASSGPAILVAQAKSNINQWSYTPTSQPMKLEVIYTFRLEKPEMERAATPRIHLESPVHIIITSNLPKIVG